MNRLFLLVIVTALTLFSTFSQAKGNHVGNGTIVTGCIKHNYKKTNQWQAVACSHHLDGSTTTTEGGHYGTIAEATKASERLAKKVAKQEIKAAKKDVRQLNKAERNGLWKKFKSLFKKKKDGVMAGPDGSGDYCPECKVFGHPDGDIYIDFSR